MICFFLNQDKFINSLKINQTTIEAFNIGTMVPNFKDGIKMSYVNMKPLSIGSVSMQFYFPVTKEFMTWYTRKNTLQNLKYKFDIITDPGFCLSDKNRHLAEIAKFLGNTEQRQMYAEDIHSHRQECEGFLTENQMQYFVVVDPRDIYVELSSHDSDDEPVQLTLDKLFKDDNALTFLLGSTKNTFVEFCIQYLGIDFS